ncbi:MAG: aminoglycoside phosphotransferase family protein [Symploca sp. SIO2E9]|nr:aminoglycoside phosphotransferase family protein [Symploca sp. SIO2E9]
MKFVLSSQNVLDYLIEHGLSDCSQKSTSQVEFIEAKNFNLLVTLPEGHKLLVKQEPSNFKGQTAAELFGEWRIKKFLQAFPAFDHWRIFLPELLTYDSENFILVSTYLDNYRDLRDFYSKENIFPTKVATQIGNLLATIHRETWNKESCSQFFDSEVVSEGYRWSSKWSALFLRNLERVGPEVFGHTPTDGLKFIALYQQDQSLEEAIAQLRQTISSHCLTHNDLKLNNILLADDWEQSSGNIVRLIDWERSDWGDPASDLGTVIGSYLRIWLDNLVISNSLTIEESLQLATTPLELLQPSIAALAIGYAKTFPAITQYYADFWSRVVQFAGLTLISGIWAIIQYRKTFNNTGIAMLQVAKVLLCSPESSMPTILGAAADKLTQVNNSA